MADIQIVKPAQGTLQNVPAEAGAKYVIDPDASVTTLEKSGEDLVLNFEDGSRLFLQDFYSEYDPENQPSFVLQGQELSAQNFFETLNADEDTIPAAGWGNAGADAADNARYHAYDNLGLAEGIDHLWQLDWGMGREFDHEEHFNSWGRRGDDGYDLEGGVLGTSSNDIPDLINLPQNPDAGLVGGTPPGMPSLPEYPRIPGGPDPEDPTDPHNPDDPSGDRFIPATGRSQVIVDEGAFLRAHAPFDPSNPAGNHTAHGYKGSYYFNARVPENEGGEIVLTGQDAHGNTIYYRCDVPTGQNGNLSFRVYDANGNELTGDAVPAFNSGGVELSNFAVVSLGGGRYTINYDYELTRIQEHDTAHRQNVAADGHGNYVDDNIVFRGEDVRIDVTDGSGDTTHGFISVEIHDDVPYIYVRPEVNADGTVKNNSATFDFGADDNADGSLGYGSDIQRIEVTRDGGNDPIRWTTADGRTTTDVSEMRPGEAWTSADGEITLSMPKDGKLTFNYAENLNPDAKNDIPLKVTIIDADGDPDSTPILLAPPKIDNPPRYPHEDPKTPDDPNDPPSDPNDPSSPNFAPTTGQAHVVVDEAALANGSRQHVAHGIKGSTSFTVDIPVEEGGVIELSANGAAITAIVRADGTIVDFGAGQFTSNNGVTLSNFHTHQTAPGHYTVTYDYVLTGNQAHAAPSQSENLEYYNVDDANDFRTNTIMFDNAVVNIKVTDGTGDVATSQINVEVHDDVPQLTVARGADQTGKVMIGDEEVDYSYNLAGTFTPNFGADGAAEVRAITINGQAVNMETGLLDYDDGEGVLHIWRNDDGTFNYEYKPVDIKVFQDTVANEKTFDVEITDGDGDVTPGVISIYQNFKPDWRPGPKDDPKPDPDPDPEDPPYTPGEHDPETGGIKIAVDEADLMGKKACTGDKDHPYTGKSSFIAKFNGGEDGTITIGKGDDVCVINVVNNDGEYSAEIESNPADGIMSDGVKVVISGAIADNTGKITVLFNYELTGAQAHEDAENVGAADSLPTAVIPIVIRDSVQGDEDYGAISFEIHDDGPVIEAVSEPNADGTARNNMAVFNFGADDNTLEGVNYGEDVQKITLEIAQRDSDGNLIKNEAGEYEYRAIEVDLSQLENNAWTGEGIKVTLDPASHRLTFNYADGVKDADKVDIPLRVTIIDADGDSAPALILLAPPKIDNPPKDEPKEPGDDTDSYVPSTGEAHVVVDEGALNDKGGSGVHAKHGFDGDNSFIVEIPVEEGGTVKLVGMGADGKPVTLLAVVSANGDIGNFNVVGGTGASFSVNGVELSGFTIENYVDPASGEAVPGKYTVSYHYELKVQGSHDQEGEEDFSQDFSSDTVNFDKAAVTVEVRDGTGDVATSEINVEVHDDVPVITAKPVKNADGTVSKNVAEYNFGADDNTLEGVNYGSNVQKLLVAVVAKDENGEFKTDENGHYVYGESKEIAYNVSEVTSQEFEDLGISVTIDPVTGKLTVNYAGNVNDEAKTEMPVRVTIIDADGDTDTADLLLAPPKIDNPPHEDPKDPGENQDFHVPSTGVAHVVVDEGALVEMKDEEGKIIQPAGSGQHVAHGIDGQASFTVEIPDEESGTVKLEGVDAQGDHVTLVATVDANGTISSGFDADGSFMSNNGVKLSSFSIENYVDPASGEAVPGKYTVSYHYELTGRQTHDKKGTERDGEDYSNDTYKLDFGAVKITVTDGTGDVATSEINVEVHDDTPKYTDASHAFDSSWSYTAFGEAAQMEANFTKGGSSQSDKFVNAGFTGKKYYYTLDKETKDGDFWQAEAHDSDLSSTGHIAHIEKSSSPGVGFSMTASVVYYKYAEGTDSTLQVENVLDVNNIVLNTAKSLFMGVNGLSVGEYNDGWKGWNSDETGISAHIKDDDVARLINDPVVGMKDGQLNNNDHANLDRLHNAYGDKCYIKTEDGVRGLDSANLSEAVIFDLKDISYGINLELGRLLSSNTRVLVTFLMTPPNNNDDVIVKKVEVELPDKINDKAYMWHYEVPDGFTKVFVSSIHSGNYTTNGFETDRSDDNHSVQEGFTIRSVEFLTAQYTATGTVEAKSADGIGFGNEPHYNWNWLAINNHTVQINDLKGGTGKVTIGEPATRNDGSLEYTAYVDGRSQPLFVATVNTNTGKWTLTQNYEFDVIDGDGLSPFRIKTIDGDGDTTTILLDIDAKFVRFGELHEGYYNKADWGFNATQDNSSDILVGTDENSLMYGKGGDDVLIGDAFNNAAGTVLAPLGDSETMNSQNDSGCEKYDTINTMIDDGYLDNSDKGATKADRLKALEEDLEQIESARGGDDALFGGIGNDILFGGAGDDYLHGDEGRDVIFGGSGNDIIVYDSNDRIISGGSGIDILIGDKNSDLREIIAGSKTQTVYGVEALIRTDGENNAESLGITSQKSLVEYGVVIEGNTIYLHNKVWSEVCSEEGTDQGAIKNYEHINGQTLQVDTSKANVEMAIFGHDRTNHSIDEEKLTEKEKTELLGNDTDIESTEGNDTILGLGGNDTIYGQDGDDTIFGGEGVDILYGDAGNDRLFGGAGSDTLYGRDGDDYLDGGSGSDKIYGDSGNDILNGGDGQDSMWGGSGDDLIFMDNDDYLIDGGDGLDIILVGNQFNYKLDDMLKNYEANQNGDVSYSDEMPMVNDVEIMISGNGAESVTSLADLGKHGLAYEKGINNDGKTTVKLELNTDENSDQPHWKETTENPDAKIRTFESSDGDNTWTVEVNSAAFDSISESANMITLQMTVQSESGGGSC